MIINIRSTKGQFSTGVPDNFEEKEIDKAINNLMIEKGIHFFKWEREKDYKTYSTKNIKLDKHRAICKELSDIYEKKNHDYGDSFSKLYEEYGMLSVVIRLFDKLYRLENLMEKEQMVEDESIEETLKDLANYCIMALMERGE